ncbi:hypothetical protein [Pseudolactococcus yaeyamensis]
MDKSKIIEDKLFYKLFSKSYSLLLLNLCFIIALLPLLPLVFTSHNLPITVVKLLVTLVYLQLILRTLFQSTRKIVFDHQVAILKTFLTSFRQNSQEKIKVSLVYSGLFTFIGIDLYFVVVVLQQFLIFPFVFSIFLLIWSGFINEMMTSQKLVYHQETLKLLAYLALKKIVINFLVLILAVLCLLAFEYHLVFTLLFCPAPLVSLAIGLHRHFERRKSEVRGN